jgi:hypothetical protein
MIVGAALLATINGAIDPEEREWLDPGATVLGAIFSSVIALGAAMVAWRSVQDQITATLQQTRLLHLTSEKTRLVALNDAEAPGLIILWGWARRLAEMPEDETAIAQIINDVNPFIPGGLKEPIGTNQIIELMFPTMTAVSRIRIHNAFAKIWFGAHALRNREPGALQMKTGNSELGAVLAAMQRDQHERAMKISRIDMEITLLSDQMAERLRLQRG